MRRVLKDYGDEGDGGVVYRYCDCDDKEMETEDVKGRTNAEYDAN
jgi:hypothetical protein